MVGSSPDHDVVLEPPLSPYPSSVSCSICLDAVLNDSQRSCANLKCGHQFHLDCIGSAFNLKGAMQCPNCRSVEKGRWLYANEVVPEYSINDWIPDQEPYELAFPELPLRGHWCPFGGLARYRSVLEDVNTPSAMYQGLLEHALFDEHNAASTVSHSYVGPPPPSNATDSLEEPVFNHHWNVITHGDIPVTHGFPALDFQYQSWIHRPLPTSGLIDGVDQVPNPPSAVRPVRDEPVTRSTSSTQTLLLGQGSGTTGALGPSLSSAVPLPQGRSHGRIVQVPPLPVFLQSGSAPVIFPPVQRNRRYYFDRRPSVVPTPPSHPDQNGAYYAMHHPAVQSHQEELHPVPSPMHPWDCFANSSLDNMELHWPSLHQASYRSF